MMTGEKIRIYCLPYAGGSSAAFAEWHKFFPDNISVINPELAGRGVRSREHFYNSIKEAAEDIYNKILFENYDGSRFALFGHSMGCFIVYELYKKISRNPVLKNKLVHIFMSGNYAPHLNGDPEHFTEYYKLDVDNFKDQIMGMQGTNPEIFENPVLKNYFVPIIRSDYYITETYRTNDVVSFSCGCSVLNGLEDELTYSDLCSWKDYSPEGFEIKNFEGDHFFINEQKEKVTEYISSVLERYERGA